MLQPLRPVLKPCVSASAFSGVGIARAGANNGSMAAICSPMTPILCNTAQRACASRAAPLLKAIVLAARSNSNYLP